MWWMIASAVMSLTCEAQIEDLYNRIPEGRFVGEIPECNVSLDFRKEEI